MSDIQHAAEAWHSKFAKAFITSVSTGEGGYFIKVKFRTMAEMHEAYAAMAKLAELSAPHSPPKKDKAGQ